MRTLSGLKLSKTGQGFTLVELVLSIAILGLLLSALVFSFSSLQRGAQLEEGATQMEGLLRFARAYSANTGKTTRIDFLDDFSPGASSNSLPIQLVYEVDPANDPGHFIPVPEAQVYINQLSDLVTISEVHLTEDAPEAELTDNLPVEAGAAVSTNRTNLAELGDALWFSYSPITFHPDGTSDSGDIVLKAIDPEEHRKVRIRLNGIVGTIKRKTLREEQTAGERAKQTDDAMEGEEP